MVNYDHAPSSGGAGVDNQPLSFIRTLRIGSWNVRSFSNVNSRKKVNDMLLKARVDICALQETKLKNDGVIDLPDFKLFYFGVDGSKRARNGVGFLIRRCLVDSLIEFCPVGKSDGRIAFLRFNKFSVVSAYCPTECNSTDKQETEFFKMVNQTIRMCPNRFPIFICGDFNARIGKPDSKCVGPWYNYNRELCSNNNGQFLLDVASNNNLFFPATFRRSSLCRRATWRSHKALGKKGPKSSIFATIDHILFQRKFINSLIDCRTYGSFTNISDHRLLILTYRAKRVQFKKQKKVRLMKIAWN